METEEDRQRIQFQRRILSLSQDTLDMDEYLAEKRILCYESDEAPMDDWIARRENVCD